MSVAGFVLLSICMGISDGCYVGIIELFTRDETGHIQIHKKGYLERPSLYNTINNGETLIKKVNSFACVNASAPRVYSSALVFAGKKTLGVRITGIDPDMEAETTSLKLKLEKGKYLSETAVNRVILSDSLAKFLTTDIGGKIVLIGQGADGSIANDLFEVAGIIADSGVMSCYMHIKTAQEFLSLSGRIHEVAVRLTDLAKAEKTAKQLSRYLNDKTIDVEPWQKVKKEFYKAMQTDQKGQHISFFILMVVVGTGILDTVLMTILERTPEFGLLRALGTSPGNLIKLIMGETALLAVIGILCGGVISFIINFILSMHGIYLAEPFYFGGVYLEKIDSVISLNIFLIPALLTFAVSMIVSIIPACRAAYLPPIEAMKSN